MRSNRIAAATLTAILLVWPAVDAAASALEPHAAPAHADPATPSGTKSATPQAEPSARFGAPLDTERLAQIRGGAELVVNDMQLAGTVADNVANRVITGSNAITEGAFANASGLPTVIQNTGANTLIQSATILNVQFQP
ncbi:hypothetical protein [Cupriavidus sp. AU9028]|uniref:hypothetical protein n=1 Tax=Cupriavidus sp. AU9028 TaxID=2871157 RepID=UPI001C948A13|nr:hypothetical protein [Cupriavidus sp. AU9028]MBY4896794.1 hypothetical protein [Cupriavidus sp. AU9028]